MTDIATRIPSGALVLLVGPTSSGKSTLTRKLIADGHLPATAVVSSDALRGVVSDDPDDQACSGDAFEILHRIVEMRLSRALTTVVDATNLLKKSRAPLTEMARRACRPVVYLVFRPERDTLLGRNGSRHDRRPERVIDKHLAQAASDASDATLASEADVVIDANAELVWMPSGQSGTDATHLPGRFAIIGDVHGQADAHAKLIARLDETDPDLTFVYVGDIGHKGPDSAGAYRQVLDLVDTGRAIVVASNHGAADGDKLGRLLDRGCNVVEAATELAERVADNPKQFMTKMVADLAGQLVGEPDGDELYERVVAHNRNVPLMLRLPGGMLVAHGGMTARIVRDVLDGQADPSDEDAATTGSARSVCLYGTPTGRNAETGYPEGRDSWVRDYALARADDATLPTVVYGHIVYANAPMTSATVGCDCGRTLVVTDIDSPLADRTCECGRHVDAGAARAATATRPATIGVDVGAADGHAIAALVVDPATGDRQMLIETVAP